MLAACCNCVPSSPAFFDAGSLFVNSVTGNDANDGLTAGTPLLTLAEVARRLDGRVMSPALAALTIFLSGTFPTQGVIVPPSFVIPSAAQTVTIKGTMTTVLTGTITAAPTAWNGAAAGADGTRGSITDAGANFTAHARRRIRLTAPSATPNALSNVAGNGGAVTIANTGQFTSTAIATVNPANGDGYVVETYDTTVLYYSIEASGAGTVRVEDLQVIAASASRCSGDVNKSPNQLVFFGCRFEGTAAALQIGGFQRFASCSFDGALVNTTFGNTNFLNCCIFNFLQINATNSLMQACLFEGSAARGACMFVGNGSYVEVIGGSGNFGTAHFGVINGTAAELVRLEDQAQCVYSNAAANMVGATGNATTNAWRIRNGCEESYVTKPKGEEAPAGVANVVLASAAALAYAAIPAIAAAPNTAAMNVRQ